MPLFKFKKQICGMPAFADGLMVPSLFERENYCFTLYELCPLFSPDLKDEPSYIGGRANELIAAK